MTLLLVADVHGAAAALARVIGSGELLLVLGDLINFIDYRNLDGILADVYGKELVSELVRFRTAGDYEGARLHWLKQTGGSRDDYGAKVIDLVSAEYRKVCGALEAGESLVTHGNVDWPDLLRSFLPESARFVDGEVVEVEGLRVGFAGGGAPTPLGVPGELSEEEMAAKLSKLGEVDVLCTHAAPDVGPLRTDVVAGRPQPAFRAIVDYLTEAGPRWHYFGDVHQPQATRWRVGRTLCRNVGYFRATERAVRHR